MRLVSLLQDSPVATTDPAASAIKQMPSYYCNLPRSAVSSSCGRFRELKRLSPWHSAALCIIRLMIDNHS